MQNAKPKQIHKIRNSNLNQLVNLRTVHMSVCVCAHHCAQLSCTIQRRTVLILPPDNQSSDSVYWRGGWGSHLTNELTIRCITPPSAVQNTVVHPLTVAVQIIITTAVYYCGHLWVNGEDVMWLAMVPWLSAVATMYVYHTENQSTALESGVTCQNASSTLPHVTGIDSSFVSQMCLKKRKRTFIC